MKYVITIGRQYGSGGRYIASELAKRLNINFYDNNLITKVAEDSGLCEEFLKQNEEKKDSIFAFMGFGDTGHNLTAAQKVSIAQFETIRKIAETESCVIVGRCADYVLKDYENTIKVFVHAPIEERIKRANKYYNLNSKNIKNVIEKTDKNRAAYYSYFTDQKWGYANNYDLCIDSSIGIDACVDIIITFINHKLDLKK